MTDGQRIIRFLQLWFQKEDTAVVQWSTSDRGIAGLIPALPPMCQSVLKPDTEPPLPLVGGWRLAASGRERDCKVGL